MVINNVNDVHQPLNQLVEDRFLVGKDVFNFIQSSRICVFTPDASEGKAICTPADPKTLENLYSRLFMQLRQEYAVFQERVAHGHLVIPDNDSPCLVKITTIRGKFLRKHGFRGLDGDHYLYPEEAFYLSERGCLQVYDRGLPLSLQQLCNTIFRSTYEFATYIAYSQFSRQGFVLRRREASNTTNPCPSLDELESLTFNLPVAPSQPCPILERLGIHSDDDKEYLTVSPSSLIPIGEKGLRAWSASRHSSNGWAKGANYDNVFPSMIAFNVFNDRKERFRKSATVEPDFVLVVMLPHRAAHPLSEENFPRYLNLFPQQKIALATVDNGELHIQYIGKFCVPFVNHI